VGRPLTTEEIAFVRGRVLHEDEALIALDKPAGLSSQGGRIQAATLDDLLAAFARSNGKRPHLVHRLDRDTSGVILAAKTKPAAAFLGKALMGRRVRKTYLAIVTPGAPSPKAGRIEAALRRISQGREVSMAVCAPEAEGAESATTLYRTLESTDEAALVELRPVTGRMHQLRVHMAGIGRPIAGDPRYGGALVLAGRPVERLMLHAAHIRFPHPAGGERQIAAVLPGDMAEFVEALGLRAPAAQTV
jgi:RluA family pseudouridine synthase